MNIYITHRCVVLNIIEYICVPGIWTLNHQFVYITPSCTIKKRIPGRLGALHLVSGAGAAGSLHVARLLGPGVVPWQCELDSTVLLPAPPDLGKSAA